MMTTWYSSMRMMVLVASLLCLNACSSIQYSAAPITAQVVDAETGQPVAGVHVVAHWQLEGGLEGGTPLGAVTAMEALTDDSGQFRFPAWGPKKVEKPSGVYANARVRSFAPELLLFKSGYEDGRLLNYGSEHPDPKNMRSQWDGKTIKLAPFHGSSAEYAKLLGGLSSHLTYYLTRGNGCSIGNPCPAACQWQNIPNTIRAIGKQFKSFEIDGIRHDNIYRFLLRADESNRGIGCASAVVILGEESK